MSDIQEIKDALLKFRDERNWKQFHNAKDLSLAISIEAAELNELFLWKGQEEIHEVNEEKVKEELADILAFSFLLADNYNLDVKQAVMDKIEKNGEKYPVEKARNSAKKYNQL
jgi:NTP pyrophosphatase (non-canonical NTP hydrolase)